MDAQQLVPKTERTAETLGRMPAQCTIDAGCCSAENLEYIRQIEASSEGGTKSFIATGPQTRRKGSRRTSGQDSGQRHTTGTDGEETENQEGPGRPAQSDHRTGRRPDPYHQGKHVLLLGLEQAAPEWELLTGCHNLLKLFKHGKTRENTRILATAGA
ncbi:hypothetical protein StoSoilA2_19030 [Arthrobacter sp. StoSoilA2]|nr:hypothetical protein StoSoilA2_19030 [Arthrobacter sp. StoSoilA2]